MDRMSGKAILEAVKECNERLKKGGDQMTNKNNRPPGDEEWRRLVEAFEWLEDHAWVLPPEERGLGMREKPKAEKPPEDLTAKRLREAMDLGVRLAEEEALWKLTMKARQVRAAELDRQALLDEEFARLQRVYRARLVTKYGFPEAMFNRKETAHMTPTTTKIPTRWTELYEAALKKIRRESRSAPGSIYDNDDKESAMQIATLQLRIEKGERKHRTKIVDLLKTRAWDLAARQMPPGHA
jgi:hypothetical protein